MRASRTQKGDKMLLSSRANPPRPLGSLPKSSLNIRQLLLNSPLPSPALPALVPRHGKKPPKLNSRKALRLLVWLAIVTTGYYVVSLVSSLTAKSSVRDISYLTATGKTYEIVGDIDLPEYPTPFSFPDSQGRKRWTVFIPQQLDFPLAAADYIDICSHAEEVARHAGNHGAKHQHLHHSDFHFMDVEEAQNAGMLPPQIAIAHPGDDLSLPVCDKSLTYILDGTDAGLGSTLLGLWLSHTIADQEGRAFFIDDSLFAYGNYSTYFKPPPKPTCRPPPKTQRVPCPRQAKHLTVSVATHPWVFGTLQQTLSQREIFDMARAGYEALFQLRPDDVKYTQHRLADLRSPSPTLLVGVHLRRGDRHPFEFAYSQGYLPSHIYKEPADAFASKSSRSKVIIASDDPEVYAQGDLAKYPRAQELIALASKSTSGSLGWEGGFFKDQFWSLGLPLEAQEQKRIGSPLPTRQKAKDGGLQRPKSSVMPIRDYRTHPTSEARQLREYIGRAYLLELSILGQSDRVVCAVSSLACRILAIMMGWERAMEQGHWKNVDGDGKYNWMALDV